MNILTFDLTNGLLIYVIAIFASISVYPIFRLFLSMFRRRFD